MNKGDEVMSVNSSLTFRINMKKILLLTLLIPFHSYSFTPMPLNPHVFDGFWKEVVKYYAKEGGKMFLVACGYDAVNRAAHKAVGKLEDALSKKPQPRQEEGRD